MPITLIWNAYQADGLEAAQAAAGEDSESLLYLALLTFGAGEHNLAASYARRSAEAAPASLVRREAAAYLERVVAAGKAGVYTSGEAFATFIRSGGNVPLYAALSAALRQSYDEYTRLDLLDIGVGDGLALLPALASSIARLDLVEPSGQMLARARTELAERDVPHRGFAEPIQLFMAHSTERWDIAQATFSLQSIPPEERLPVLRWLRSHSDQLLLAEFDVPDLGELYAPARVRYFVARYEQGLAEYPDDEGLVAQGFLMPVFFGAFDPSAARTNYEQPIELWEFDLHRAGFTSVTRRHLYDYWWAPAYLIDAR